MSEFIARNAIIGESYRLLELLGRGGMGEVWMAQHLRLPRRVALKILLPAAFERAEFMARFRREAQVTSKLGHPNIVEVLDSNTLPDGRPYFVMELLEGENLRHRLRDGKLSLAKSLEILRQVASGLHAAHRAGVVHRDLKPENIFVARVTSDFGTESEVAKIVDFGISKLEQPQDFRTEEDHVMGTAPYMAPEQAQGKNDQVGERTDQFALATIAYELLTGRRLFRGTNMAEIIFKVVYEQPAELEQLASAFPGAIYHAICRALQKNPDDRFPNVVAFYAALSGEVVITGDKMAAIPPIPAQPILTPAGQRITPLVDGGADTLPDAVYAQVKGPTPMVPVELPSGAQSVPLEPSGSDGSVAGEAAYRETVANTLETGADSPDKLPETGPVPKGEPAPQEQDGPLVATAATVDSRPKVDASAPAVDRQHGVAEKGAGSGKLSLAIFGLLAVGVVAAVVWMQRTDDGDSQSGGRTLDTTALDGARPTAATPDGGKPGPAGASAAVGDAAARTRGKGSNPERPAAKKNKGSRSTVSGKGSDGRPRRAISGEAATLLRQAERALAAKDYDGALRKARRALQHGRRPQVFSAMAKAYCGLRNLGMVRATLRNVPGRDKSRIRRFCKKVGMSF